MSGEALPVHRVRHVLDRWSASCNGAGGAASATAAATRRRCARSVLDRRARRVGDVPRGRVRTWWCARGRHRLGDAAAARCAGRAAGGQGDDWPSPAAPVGPRRTWRSASRSRSPGAWRPRDADPVVLYGAAVLTTVTTVFSRPAHHGAIAVNDDDASVAANVATGFVSGLAQLVGPLDGFGRAAAIRSVEVFVIGAALLAVATILTIGIGVLPIRFAAARPAPPPSGRLVALPSVTCCSTLHPAR